MNIIKNIMKKILLLALCLIGTCTSLWSKDAMHPQDQITYVKKMVKLQREPFHTAYLQLIHYADSLQGMEHHALADYSVPGYYVKPAEHRANSLALAQDAFAAYSSALAYRLSGKKAYGEKACYFMNAWAEINKKYSQPDGPLVMSYVGTAMMMAAELMKDSPLWKEGDKQKFVAWTGNVYQKAANEIRERKNNWADWGRLGSLLAASFLEDSEEVERNVELIKGDLGAKFAADGHMPHEVVRGGNGIWYTYFSLAPMTASFWAVYNLTGENLFAWEEDGKSVKGALDYLLYYQKNPSEWKWFEGPRPGTHKTWPDNLLEAMYGIYGNPEYLSYVAESRPHIYPVHHFAWSFPTLMPVTLEGYDLDGKVYAAKKADVEKLRKQFAAQAASAPFSVEKVNDILNTIKPDGTWPGINYEDTSRTAFEHEVHLSNMQALSVAYKQAGSPFKGKKNVKAAIDKSLGYWLENDFICENWWWNQVGTPNAMVAMLLVLDKDLSEYQASRMLEIASRGNVNAWGARPSGDRIKIAGIQAKSALFRRNVEEIEMLMRIIEGEIKFSRERGIQYDYSFHHRIDWVNNTLSYGSGYGDAFAEWASNVAGTCFRFSEEQINKMVDYYLDGMCKQMVYGKYTDTGVKNRDIARPGTKLSIWSTKTPERLVALTDYRRDELEEIIKSRKGEEVVPRSFAKFFWNTDHFVIQRPDFYTSVRMYSSRNANMEVGYNGEGLTNHFRGDGTNYISLEGDEYLALTPVCDWMKIPGATVVQLEKMPDADDVQKWGLTDFVGAVTDGTYGAAGFDFKSPHTGLVAKKAWFFFDDEYLCLGSGITNKMKLPAMTTMNQCLLDGEVLAKDGNGVKALEKGSRNLEKVNWVLHDGVGYIFPGKPTVTLSNQEEKGSWAIANIQTDVPRTEVRKDVFKLYLDHGVQCSNAAYEYLVVPATTKEELAAYEKASPVTVIANTPTLQAAKHDGLGIAYAVFYNHGTVKISDKLSVTMDSPGILMVKCDADGKVRTLAVSDPARRLGKIHLSVSQKLAGSDQEGVSVIWDEKTSSSLVAFELPQEQYGGKSVVYNCK